jgi:starvation-inducible DNA-binding protein
MTLGEMIMHIKSTSKTTKVDSSQPLLRQHRYEIQQYSTLRDLPIALNLDDRTESCMLVNQMLADTIYSLPLLPKASLDDARH